MNYQIAIVIITIRLMHESAIGGHDQWLPRCRSNIGIGNEMVGSFLLVLNSMALYVTHLDETSHMSAELVFRYGPKCMGGLILPILVLLHL